MALGTTFSTNCWQGKWRWVVASRMAATNFGDKLGRMTFSGEADRPQRLIDSARALANETGSAAFTVAQLTGRAGLSLKAFYSCFRSKDDLLLALLAEDSRLGAEFLATRIDAPAGPDALRMYVLGLFDMLTPPGALGYAGVLVREHRRLTEVREDELNVALAPLVDLSRGTHRLRRPEARRSHDVRRPARRHP